MEQFKPFNISSWKRFIVNPQARCYSSICKILRLHEGHDYEIEINIKEVK